MEKIICQSGNSVRTSDSFRGLPLGRTSPPNVFDITTLILGHIAFRVSYIFSFFFFLLHDKSVFTCLFVGFFKVIFSFSFRCCAAEAFGVTFLCVLRFKSEQLAISVLLSLKITKI